MAARVRRRRVLIKRGFQLRYASQVFLYLALTASAAVAMLYLGVWNEMLAEFSESRIVERLGVASRLREYEQARAPHPDPSELAAIRQARLLSAREQEVVQAIFQDVNARLTPKLVLLMAVVALAALIVSHRIAGPLYRLEREAEAWAQGDLTRRFSLRRGDELKELAAALDGAQRAWRKRLSQVAGAVAALRQEVDRASRWAAADPGAGTALRARMDDLEALLAAFQVR
jgi:methyl-accepting chemotaxis protein